MIWIQYFSYRFCDELYTFIFIFKILNFFLVPGFEHSNRHIQSKHSTIKLHLCYFMYFDTELGM
jgi:hypothetical protein